jgi:transposase
MTYSDEEKALIAKLRSQGVPWNTIASLTKRNPSALATWYSRNRINLTLPPKTKIKKRLTDGRVGLQIKQIVASSPQMSIRDITAELENRFSPNIRTPSKSGVQQFIAANGFKMIKLLKKPLVSIKNQRKRIEFAEENLEELDRLMHETIWSDETMVRKLPKHQEISFRCHSNVDRENLPSNLQVHSGGFGVMFWGCFSSLGLGPLVALEGNQNQDSYLATLREFLLPEIETARDKFNVQMTFMQDNAPCHKTQKVLNFLAENNIPTLNWPPQSPDMNPIENLWAIIKFRRQKKFGIPLNRLELIEQVFQIWEEIDEELIGSLTNSIENRLREVIRLKGKPTKY